MKQYYLIAWLFDESTVGLLRDHTTQLEHNYGAMNPLKACPPHITIKSPFELDNTNEANLISVIREQVNVAAAVPIFTPGEFKYFDCAHGQGKHLVLTFSDLLDKHPGNASLFRELLSKTVEDKFSLEGSGDADDLFFTSLGLVRDNYGRAQMVRPLARPYSVPRITTVAVLKQANDGVWLTIAEINYLKH